MRARQAVLLLAGFLLSGAACSAILDLQPPSEPADGGGTDGTTGGEGGNGDAPTGDAPAGDAPGPDGGGDALVCLPVDAGVVLEGGSGPTVWNAFDNPVVDDAGDHAWAIFDTSTLLSSAGDFQGAAFDGRYIYLVPVSSGIVTRYDTLGSFSQRGSWSTFDTTTLPLPGGRFSGAVYDGRYVTFVPSAISNGADVEARYDTTGDFTSPGSWSTFDTLSLPVPDGGAPAQGFHGGVFDGRYVYFVPYKSGAVYDGRVVRYDTFPLEGGAPDADAGEPDAHDAAIPDAEDSGVDAHDAGVADAQDSSTDAHESGAADAGPPPVPPQWSSFDVATQNASAIGFFGGVYDGRYVYLVPFYNEGTINSGYSGWVARYDTTLPFTSIPSWASYDTSQLTGGKSFGFQGGAFDGRYVYFVPSRGTVVTRYDTQGGDFFSSGNWSAYDVSPLIGPDASADTGHFTTAGFDGRYMYFVPSFAGFGGVVRYDTFSTFSSPCAWSEFDFSQYNAQAQNFAGVVYDGQYLYFVPVGSVVTRFDTKSPPSMPNLPSFRGSFY
jgi:hypothetical protein